MPFNILYIYMQMSPPIVLDYDIINIGKSQHVVLLLQE